MCIGVCMCVLSNVSVYDAGTTVMPPHTHTLPSTGIDGAVLWQDKGIHTARFYHFPLLTTIPRAFSPIEGYQRFISYEPLYIILHPFVVTLQSKTIEPRRW